MTIKTEPDVVVARGVHAGVAGGTWPLEVKDLGCLGVVAEIWDDLGLTELIDLQVPVDEQVQLGTGMVLKALVLNIVGGRDPLYRVQDWAEGVPLELVVGKGVLPEQLNDSALARHLDRLFDAGGEGMFNTCCLRVIEREGVSLAKVHGDTTSRLVFGEYLREEDEAISITRGHSKDHRPDLKQVMYGVTVSSCGVPLTGQLLSGNTSDKKWHGGMLDVVNKQLVVGRPGTLHYVGDSALITSANLELAEQHGIVLTGRLPRTVTVHQTMVVCALHEPLPMTDLGKFSERKGATSYQGCVIDNGTLFGRRVQLGVFRPTPANKRAESKVLRHQRRAMDAALEAASKLMDTPFACEPDARAALDRFEAEHGDKLLRITGDVALQHVPGKRPAGRPRKDAAEIPVTTQYRVTLTVEADAAAAKAAIDEESLFVLVHTGTKPLSPREMLGAYKEQSVVENRFPFLKDPAWAEVFFIKTPHRLEALGYVLLLALLVWSVWERRVRANLKASGEAPIVDTTGMKKNSPTAKVCRHIMNGLKVVRRRTEQASTAWEIAGPLTAEQRRVARFSAKPPKSQIQKPSAKKGLG